MPKQAYSSAVVRESWRSDSANAELALARRRLVWRLLVTSLLALVVFVFGYLLFSPFFHPTLRLGFLTAGSYGSMEMKPIPFFQEDAARFLSLDGGLQRRDAADGFSVMETPQSARDFFQRIADPESRESDVYVIQISAHPVLLENRPYLKCGNYSHHSPESSSISIEELLNLAEGVTTGAILVCLDLGPSDAKAAKDMIRDRFLRGLEETLAKKNNPRLWVLASNSPQESSYASLDLRASIFSYAVAKGLSGDAELNNDLMIDLEEFTRFVIHFTRSQVRNESGGNAEQTPILFSTAASRSTPISLLKITSASKQSVASLWSSILPSIWGSSKSEEESTDPSKEEEAEKAKAEKNWLTEYFDRTSNRIQERTMEQLEDNLNLLPYFIGNPIKKKVGILDDEPAVSTYSKSPNAAAAAAAAPTEESSSASGEPETTAQQDPPLAPEAVNRSGKSMPDLSLLASPDPSNLNTLRIAWQFCEFLELPQAGVPRPLDLAPHAWNEFASYLHGIETRLRTQSEPETETLRLRLISEIAGAYQLATTGTAQIGDMAKRISSQMPDIALPDVALTSVGLMENLAELGGPPLSAEIATQLRKLDSALAENDPSRFLEWHAQVPIELANRCTEVFWSSQFASRPEIPWRISQRAIVLWRKYEQLSSHPYYSNDQIQKNLNASRIHLMEGTRQAIDRIGSDWEERCARTLAQAEFYLNTSVEQCEQLREAIYLRNQTLAELPSILKWRKIAATNLGNTQFDEDFDHVLTRLSKLCELLLAREQSPLEEIVRSRDNLKVSVSRIRDYWEEESKGLIESDATELISRNWKIDSLLEPPLIKSPLRTRLLSLSNVTPELKPMELDIDRDSKLPSLPSLDLVTSIDEQQIHLEARAARLAGLQLDVANLDSVRIADAINAFYGTLADELSKVVDRQGAASADTAPADTVPADTVPADTVRAMRLRELREADQALRLLPAVNSPMLDGKPLESELLQLELLECLQRKRIALRQFIPDALPAEIAFLTDVSGRLDFLVNAISPAARATPLEPPRLGIRGTSSVSLLAEPRASGEIVLQNSGKSIGNVWLLVDYDPSVLEVECPRGVLLQRASSLPQKVDEALRQAEQELMLAIASGSDSEQNRKAIEDTRSRVTELRNQVSYPLHPALGRVAPTMGLAAGATVTIPFEVRRVGSGPSQSKIVWKLVGDDEFVRHEVITQLPEAEKLRLMVDGVESGWAATREGIDLFLLSGRTCDYRIGLRNESGRSRSLSAELAVLLAPNRVSLPDGFLTDSVSQEFINSLGPKKSVAVIPEIALSGGSDTVWLPLEGIASAATALPADPKAPPPDPIPVNHGLVLILTDQVTKQKCFRRIETRVRHPRSYVDPSARYDATSERAEIRLTVRNQGAEFADGVQVVGRIREAVPRGTEMKLEGTIRLGESATLYCQVPPAGLRELTFELDIDGFPRAFVIKVPCWRTNNNIPIAADSQRIQFLEPSSGTSIGPNFSSPKIRLQIDSAAGSFETKRDYVEVGWDLNRDRDFSGETTLKFSGDRQTSINMTSLEAGRISFTAKVSDLDLELPNPALKNQKVNLLARMYAGGQMVWSEPIEVTADFDPPRISGVEIVPGTTFPMGADLQLRVGVDDAGLSGVGKVELKIDTAGVGSFVDSLAAPKDCVRQNDGSWTLSLPTADLKPGRAKLIVRATDRVGNVSEESKTSLAILSEEDWAIRLKNMPRELSGTVLYSDAPLAGAKITLEDEKGTLLQRTTTDEKGAFRIPNAPIGKLKVVAIGVVKNRPRLAEETVEIAPTQTSPMRLRMLAK